MPDGPAYFCSRGSVLGQVPGEVVAAAFGVFNPAIVVPLVAMGWAHTDAATICAARTAGAVGQLERILGAEPDGLARATELLHRANRAAPPRGPPAVRRPALARPARRPDGRHVAARRPAPRVPRRRPHRGLDARPASTPPRSVCSPSCTGACRCAPTSARGRGATPTSTPPRPASRHGAWSPTGLHRRGSGGARAGRARHRRAVPADHRRARRRLRRAGRHPRALGRRHQGRRRLPGLRPPRPRRTDERRRDRAIAACRAAMVAGTATPPGPAARARDRRPRRRPGCRRRLRQDRPRPHPAHVGPLGSAARRHPDVAEDRAVPAARGRRR